MTEDNFWNWAVAAYERKGVADICLDLQDQHGQNVPLLLWAAWATGLGYGVDEALAAEAAATAGIWIEAVIAPLRAVRRRMKTALSAGDTIARLPLREKIKTIELQSERALMGELERLLTGRAKAKYEVNQEIVADMAAAMARVALDSSRAIPVDAHLRLAEALIKG